MQKKHIALTVLSAGLASFAVTASAGMFDSLFGSSKKPVTPLIQSTEKSVVGNTLWSFNNNEASSWKVEKAGKVYVVKQLSGGENFLDTQLEGTLVSKEGKFKPGAPTRVAFADKGEVMQLVYGKSKKPLNVETKITAFDISGQPIADFLKKKDGQPSAMASTVGNKIFPTGSVGYLVTTKFIDNQLVLPVRESFTNAKTSKDLVENFSKVPFCFSYTSRPGAKAYGVLFNAADANKKEGTFVITPVRRDTIFCRPTEESPIKGGTWKYVPAGDSGAVVLNIPRQIDPRDYGIQTDEKGKVQFAFIAPAKGDHVFRPGKFYDKGHAMSNDYYLFNTTAANAIRGVK